MYRLFESIRLEHGQFFNLEYHQQRMRRSFLNEWGVSMEWDLKEYLGGCKIPKEGLHKCRLNYDLKGEQIEIIPYTPRNVRTLKVVESNSILYNSKFIDRKLFDELLDKREGADDILIVKEGCITDTSYSNIVFKEGKKWFTPDTFLLQGVMREKLLDEGVISEKRITLHDLSQFSHFKLINAMLGFKGPEIDVNNIVS